MIKEERFFDMIDKSNISLYFIKNRHEILKGIYHTCYRNSDSFRNTNKFIIDFIKLYFPNTFNSLKKRCKNSENIFINIYYFGIAYDSDIKNEKLSYYKNIIDGKCIEFVSYNGNYRENDFKIFIDSICNNGSDYIIDISLVDESMIQDEQFISKCKLLESI